MTYKELMALNAKQDEILARSNFNPFYNYTRSSKNRFIILLLKKNIITHLLKVCTVCAGVVTLSVYEDMGGGVTDNLYSEDIITR